MEEVADQPQEPGATAAPQYREIPEGELKHILAQHKMWVETEGQEGEEANLSNANLQGANLSNANLQRANLCEANLEGADLQGAKLDGANLQGAHLWNANLFGAKLRGAKLRGANLSNANFQGANLTGATFERRILTEDGEPGTDLPAANLTNADLQNADLSDAKLSGVTGLLADKLAGADLSNAKLPEDIAEFDGLARAEEISRIARPIFIGLLAGCFYSWLTIATTTDARLLTNSASSPLPIIGTEIPIAGFYWVTPILLLGVYVYLHLYLQRP